MLAEFGADVIGDILVEGDLCVFGSQVLADLVCALPCFALPYNKRLVEDRDKHAREDVPR